MLIIDGAAVRTAFPMSEAIETMRTALRAFGEGKVYQPIRMLLDSPQLGGITLLKPAALGGEPVGFGLKVVSLFPDNPQRGIPAISGFVALLDAGTGVPTAILDGAVVTEIRTGAVSAVATDLLAKPDAGDLALLGAGVQARAHLEAVAAVRTLRRVRVWNHKPDTADAFVAWAGEQGYEVESCTTAREAVAGADIVCTVTSSREPVLEGDWLEPGAHVNAVGAFQPDARELATSVVARARVVVDSREEAAKGAGDLLLAMKEGAVPKDADFPELGELVAGTRAASGSGDVTVFESLGLALEDVAAAVHVVAGARERGLGVEVSF